jgi:hypothetical protein
MFSISHFIFGSSDPLKEGGNTRALVRDPATGLVVGPDQVRQFRGRPAFAEKIDLRSGRINRQDLRRDVIEMLQVLDEEFNADHGRPLWDRAQRDDILGSGFAFNGSSAHLFAPPETMSDEKFIKFKPTVGDIDLIVPDDTPDELFRTLNRLEDAQLTPRIAYIGHNKKSSKVDQINALFSYTWDPDAPAGQGDTFFQIDFEFSEFEGGRPTEWAKFSHSSSWRDVEAGVKALAHKILLFSLAAVRSPPPVNARVATPTGTAENPRTSMEKDKKFIPPPPEEIEARVQARERELRNRSPRASTDALRRKAEAEIKSEINAAGSRPLRLRPLKSFDIVTGYSDRYRKLDWQHDGNDVYKYLKRVERDNATRDLKQIFVGMFGDNPPPTEKEMDDFGSFLGTLDIMKNRMTPPEIVSVYEGMVIRFFGEKAQNLSATDKQDDMSVKDKVLDVFRQVLPEAESSTIDIEGLKSDFYARYKIRGEEGFAEDADAPSEIDESRVRRLNRLIESVIWGS